VLYVPYSTYGTFEVHRYMSIENEGILQALKSSLVQSVKIYTAGSTEIMIR